MKQRSIIVGSVPRLVLWEGTEDEESFRIYGLKTERPYARAYGKKYFLTDTEIKTLRLLIDVRKELLGC